MHESHNDRFRGFGLELVHEVEATQSSHFYQKQNHTENHTHRGTQTQPQAILIKHLSSLNNLITGLIAFCVSWVRKYLFHGLKNSCRK